MEDPHPDRAGAEPPRLGGAERYGVAGKAAERSCVVVAMCCGSHHLQR
ncbi:hypothetical protein KBY97_06095 [Synechococcus sp. ATX 2A4]|nr:hypothetical protein [Synechococcus sp. ATX 2A4]MCP9884696.1 hypothetical protein [Synechococcus sp. ATX 2A4]